MLGAWVCFSDDGRGRPDLRHNDEPFALSNDALDVGDNMRGQDRELVRSAPDGFVFVQRHVDLLDARQVRALAGERVCAGHVLKRRRELLQPLVDLPKQRLVAGSSLYLARASLSIHVNPFRARSDGTAGVVSQSTTP
jgi:hypothetical protein